MQELVIQKRIFRGIIKINHQCSCIIYYLEDGIGLKVYLIQQNETNRQQLKLLIFMKVSIENKQQIIIIQKVNLSDKFQTIKLTLHNNNQQNLRRKNFQKRIRQNQYESSRKAWSIVNII